METKYLIICLALFFAEFISADELGEVITDADSIPYHVSISLADSKSPDKILIECSGAIVSNHYVLAANNCLNNYYYDENHVIKQWYACLESVEWKQCKNLSKIESGTFFNDLGLGRVDTVLEKSIDLADSAFSTSDSSAVVIGWNNGGDNPVIKKIQVNHLMKCGKDKICIERKNLGMYQLGGLLVMDKKLIGVYNSTGQYMYEFVDVGYYNRLITVTIADNS